MGPGGKTLAGGVWINPELRRAGRKDCEGMMMIGKRWGSSWYKEQDLTEADSLYWEHVTCIRN